MGLTLQDVMTAPPRLVFNLLEARIDAGAAEAGPREATQEDIDRFI